MDKIEYEILKTLSVSTGMQATEFTSFFFEETSIQKRQTAAKTKFKKFEKFGLVQKQHYSDVTNPTYELTKGGINLMRGEKYPIGLEDELVADGWVDAEDALPEVGEPVLVAVKVGSMSPHLILKADMLMGRGKFSCEMDWVSVLYWKNFDKQ